MARLERHREEAEKRPQGLPDKPQRRLPSNKALHLEGKAPFNQREEAAPQVPQACGVAAAATTTTTTA